MNVTPTTYRVGVATCDITPPVGTHMAGFGSRTQPSEGVYRRLGATVTIINDGEITLLLAGAEIASFGDLTPRVRGRIAQATGIDDSNIILCPSHTHSGPTTRALDDLFDSPRNHAYLDELIDKLARCARDAQGDLAPAMLRCGEAHCDLATNRRRPDPDNPGRVLPSMLPYPQGVSDHGVPVIAAYAPDGTLRHVLFSYGCHPSSYSGLLIGGDYVGFAIDAIRRVYPGVTVGFMQGCGGDQKIRPHDPDADTFIKRTVDQLREAGDTLGAAVTDLLAGDAPAPVQGTMSVNRTMMELRCDPVDESFAKAMRNSEDKWYRMWATKPRHELHAAVPFEVQTVAFGRSLAIAAMAAEMSADYGLRLRKELGGAFARVLPMGYANDIVGYIGSLRQKHEGGYEGWSANYYWFRTGPWEDDTEDRIVETIRNSLGV
jgi:hypothetical protein